MSIITISRGTFSGGQSLAECTAQKLGYRCVAREVLTQAAREYGADEEKMYKSLVEKPGLLDRLTLERVHYTTYIQAALCREVQGDDVVYHGHAGHLLLKGIPHVVKVRVIANMEQRIKAAMESQGLAREQAMDYIEKVDAGRAKWSRYLYGVDWTDPSLYDLVINLDHVSVSNACEVLSAAAGLEEFKTTPESQGMMDDLVLAAAVRAQVAADGHIGDAEVEIEATGGVVTAGGTVGSRIKEIARGTPGVTEVIPRLRVRTFW
jgi:cytidylate kinase